MSAADQFMTALCLWREARGEGNAGMVAVGCVIRNRTLRHSSSYYAEVIKPWQFSSITASGDSQLSKYPLVGDASMLLAVQITDSLMGISGAQPDVTGGATLYYDDSISFPSSWNPNRVQATVKIGRLNFFKEL